MQPRLRRRIRHAIRTPTVVVETFQELATSDPEVETAEINAVADGVDRETGEAGADRGTGAVGAGNPAGRGAGILMRCMFVSTFTQNVHTKVHVDVQQQLDELEEDKRYS